jgi:D-alanine-D-alanine ligase
LKRIAVVMGGESEERDVSRVTGTAVARALADRGHQVTLLDTREGVLALGAGETPRIGERPPGSETGEGALALSGSSAMKELAGSLADVDAVFIALHGGWGENGTVQAFFEILGLPYTGSGVLGSALAMDKDRAKRVFGTAGVPTPEWRMVEWDPEHLPTKSDVAALARELSSDIVVKPNEQGSTVGLTVVKRGEDPFPAVEKAARYGRRVLLERYVPGRELTVAILDDEALPIVEIVPEEGVYSYEAKYTPGRSRYEVPADLPGDLAARIRLSALAAFHALRCEGFARVDYRLAPDSTFYCLEINTIPGLTPLSLVPMAAKARGISFEELVERIIESAIARGPRRGGPAPHPAGHPAKQGAAG